MKWRTDPKDIPKNREEMFRKYINMNSRNGEKNKID